MPEKNKDETDKLYNIQLFVVMLSFDFLYLFHPCICDIYNDNQIKPVNLDKLMTILNTF